MTAAKDDNFKSSFIHPRQHPEADKLFRACVKLEAGRWMTRRWCAFAFL